MDLRIFSDRCVSHLVPVERFVHFFDFLAVEDLLHEAGPDVSGGPHARGRDPGDEDGGGGPGSEGGQDSPGDGEAPAHNTDPGPHGPAHSASDDGHSSSLISSQQREKEYYRNQMLSK